MFQPYRLGELELKQAEFHAASPMHWVRQTKPGGMILATVGSWPYGTGLAKVTVREDGTAEGQIIGRSSFMQARSQTIAHQSVDLSARTAYAASQRPARIPPSLLDQWMPARLPRPAHPRPAPTLYARAPASAASASSTTSGSSFAAFTGNGTDWTVRQGGPVAHWDDIEETLTALHDAGEPGISSVRLHITDRSHTYWIKGHRIATSTE